MDYEKAIEPVTVFKTKSAQLIKRARESGRPIIITQSGKATAVIQDIDTFQRQRKALLLLKFLARGDQELREGKGISRQKALRHFENRLKKLQK